MSGRGLFRGALLGAVIAMAGCATAPEAPPEARVTPEARPEGLTRAATAPDPEPGRSARSRDLAAYYARLQNDLLVRGLLRTDGGGPDTAYTDTMLVRNFERLALEEEYVRGEGLRPSSGEASAIKKWRQPVRIVTEFGPAVDEAQAVRDRNAVTAYAARLARITGHPIEMVEDESDANFNVLFMSEDDMDLVVPRIRSLVPTINPTALRIFDRLPRNIHCLVIAFSEERGGYSYGRAIALIRAEHPDLLRLSCIHEEVAQGLGIGNDDPRARPSIFNDDDEFALLTSHDEMLLRILYDPALEPGMTAEEAMPIVRDRAEKLMEGPRDDILSATAG